MYLHGYQIILYKLRPYMTCSDHEITFQTVSSQLMGFTAVEHLNRCTLRLVKLTQNIYTSTQT